MDRFPGSFFAIFGLLLGTSCSSVAMIDTTSGERVDTGKVADACGAADVVFFGEVHSSDPCHEQQRLLLVALRERREDLVLSMEMFERDVQGHLDAYLAGQLPEADFLKKARAWKNWDHYRPLVQIAAAHKLPVLAANAPTPLVRKVSRGGGLDAVKGEDHVAKQVEVPRDDYFRSFVHDITGGEGSVDEPADWVLRFYEAQCLRDETMAETIATYLDRAHKAGRRPLVIHFCGSFHVNNRRGTVPRLNRRVPGLQVKVIVTTQTDDLADPAWNKEQGDFHLFVPTVPTPGGDGFAHKPKDEPGKSKPAEPQPTSRKAAEPEVIEGGRPGLGFKPIYEAGDEPGVGVEFVVPGGAAAKAGILPGDVIIELAGEPTEDVREYVDVLRGLEVGQKIKVKVSRKGKALGLDATVGVSNR